MPRRLTYAGAGVDRDKRAESKKALRLLRRTYGESLYGEVLQLPYGNIFPIEKDRYLDLSIEGVGTKVLIAQLAEKYNTIGIDGVAMAVNDVIRSGAKPLAIADNIHAQVSDSTLVKEWLTGITTGGIEAGCVVPSGEIGDVAELINGLVRGKGFDMVVSAVGEVAKERVISGRNINSNDIVIGLRSSGIHSNGISLARRTLFKQWGGKYEPRDIPEGLDMEVVSEILKPTKIYVKPLLEVARMLELKAAVHITGDAYLKFNRLSKFSRGIGFEFDNFNPQPIFGLIQKTASDIGGMITDSEMFKTFNMGWGFAVIVKKEERERAIDVLVKTGTNAEQIGFVRDSPGVRIKHGRKRILLK